MDVKGDTPDAVVAALAARQHGVVSVEQLHAAGISDHAIRRRAAAGRLHRIHQGVYAVGHPGLAREGVWMAAILACGRRWSAPTGNGRTQALTVLARWGAVLSHRSAAELWGLLPRGDRRVEVSVPSIDGKRARRGIHVHRSRTLASEHATSKLGIPLTTPARTIADLRRATITRGCPAAVPRRELRRAIRQAGVLGLQIDKPAAADRTRSELEHLFLRLCEQHEVPAPEVNVRVDRFLVDFLWRDRALIVETDGFRYHSDRAAFEDDRDRDLRLKSVGYEVIRLSYRQVAEDPAQIVDTLKLMLEPRRDARGGASAPPRHRG
jgi:hypothetical protein